MNSTYLILLMKKKNCFFYDYISIQIFVVSQKPLSKISIKGQGSYSRKPRKSCFYHNRMRPVRAWRQLHLNEKEILASRSVLELLRCFFRPFLPGAKQARNCWASQLHYFQLVSSLRALGIYWRSLSAGISAN